jgi:hypothetical protein
MYGLQPRTTLDGKPFDAAKAHDIHAGLTEADVRSLLGEPFEVEADARVTRWRYYERFTPRGCDPPTVTQEFRVSFVAGVVVSSEPATPPTSP